MTRISDLKLNHLFTVGRIRTGEQQAPRSLLPAPCSLLPAPRSLLPAPRSPLPAPRSLLPAPPPCFFQLFSFCYLHLGASHTAQR
jgi:hypothetical protein